MIIVGLTGGIGSGKSTVAKLFEKLGASIIDTDVIARKLVEINTPAYQEIVTHFGNEILHADQSLNRAALKHRIINQDDDRLALENILHPRIQEMVTQQIKSAAGHYCIVVIPLLTEKANYPMLDRILVVDTPVSEQIQRVSQRDGLNNTDIKKLINIQATPEQRLIIADDVIHNNQGLSELHVAVQQMHDKYLKL